MAILTESRLMPHRPASFFKRLRDASSRACYSFIPEAYLDEPERVRRSRVQIYFGSLGCLFGLSFAVFCLAISHWWGAGIIIVCSLIFAQVPWLVKRGLSHQLTGHLFAFVLLAGFSSLATVEGGLHGHAIAWLAAIPLCVLLLLDLRGALCWSALCFVAAMTFGILETMGINFPRTYPPQWDTVISIAGYAGLVPFMALLGVIFELTRAKAFDQLESAMAALSAANQNLRKLNREKDEFLNIAAHDLKNPLTGVIGYADLLTHYKSPTPDQIRNAATMIHSASQRMLSIISDLLDIQKIEQGTMQVELVRCPVIQLMASMFEQYEQRAAQKQIRLVLEHEPGSLYVFANPLALEQILDNLISNAIKYSPQDTTVRCSCISDGAAVLIEVADQGPGLSEADQKKLFRKYAKLTPRPTGGESSNGLGLWIVQRMAQSMGGDVYCRSTLEKGSVFGLSLRRWIPEESHLPAPDDSLANVSCSLPSSAT